MGVTASALFRIMKKIYFKYYEQNGAIVTEKQKAAKVISETPDGIITAEYEMKGKKEMRAFCEGQYSEVPYLMSF